MAKLLGDDKRIAVVHANRERAALKFVIDTIPEAHELHSTNTEDGGVELTELLSPDICLWGMNDQVGDWNMVRGLIKHGENIVAFSASPPPPEFASLPWIDRRQFEFQVEASGLMQRMFLRAMEPHIDVARRIADIWYLNRDTAEQRQWLRDIILDGGHRVTDVVSVSALASCLENDPLKPQIVVISGSGDLLETVNFQGSTTVSIGTQISGLPSLMNEASDPVAILDFIESYLPPHKGY